MRTQRIITLLATLMLSINTYSDFVEINGIRYDLSEEKHEAYVATNYSRARLTTYKYYSGSIDIPAVVYYGGKSYTVTGIDRWAFFKCNVTSITIPSTITFFNYECLRDCSGKAVINCYIDETIAGTGYNLFAGSSFSRLIFGDKVTKIGKGAARELESVTSVSIMSGDIGEEAFYGCKNMSSLNFGNNVTSIGNLAFCQCPSLKSVSIPCSVRSIGEGAFAGCSNLQSVTISDGLETIGYGAFVNCSNLRSIVVPKTVTNTKLENTFSGCTNLSRVTCMMEKVPKATSYTFKNVPLKDDTLYVPASAINAYKKADIWKDFGTILAYPNPMTYLSLNRTEMHMAANSHTLLNATILPRKASFKQLTWTSSNEDVAVVDQHGFVRSLDYGETTITATSNDGSGLSASCKIIVDLAMIIHGTCGKKVEYILDEDYALNIFGSGPMQSFNNSDEQPWKDYRSTIKSVNIVGTEDASMQSKNYSNGIMYANSQTGLTEIGNNAFAGCTSLDTVTIASNVMAIGEKAFCDCSSLSTVICFAEEVPTVWNDAFYNVPTSSATLLVPESAVDDYSNTAPWNTFGTILSIETPTGIKNINASKKHEDTNTVVYDLSGRKMPAPRRGINILRSNDGKTRKVIITKP